MPRPATNKLAIVALVCGIASWVVAPLVASAVGVVVGHRARKRIRHTAESGARMAMLGLVLSYLNLAVACLAALGVGLSMLGVVSCEAPSWVGGAGHDERSGIANRAAARMQLQGSVQGIQLSCNLGADLGQHFHPDVLSEMKQPACELTDETVDALMGPDAQVDGLSGTRSAGKADALGLEPERCHRLTAGSSKVIGCKLPDGTFKLIHVENLGSH